MGRGPAILDSKFLSELRRLRARTLHQTVRSEHSFLYCLLFAVAMSMVQAGAQTDEDQYVFATGTKVHVKQVGVGGPAVVFEAGLGEDLSTWDLVQPKVAARTSTFSYDRPGLGSSQPSSQRRDGISLAIELHDVLHSAGLKPPYLLVGHSLGGAVIQLFASRYPSEVAGMVLVDPEDGRLLSELKRKLAPDVWKARNEALAKFGPMPTPVQREFDAASITGEQVRRSAILPKVPIVILTGTKSDPSFPGNPTEQNLKLNQHRQFVRKYPDASHILVPSSRHYVQRDASEEVLKAIYWVMKRSGFGTGLKTGLNTLQKRITQQDVAAL